MAAFDRMRQAEIDKELTRLNEAAVAASPKSAKKLAKMLRNVFLFYPEPTKPDSSGAAAAAAAAERTMREAQNPAASTRVSFAG